MKALVLAAALAFVFGACGDAPPDPASTPPPTATSAPSPAPTPTATSTPSPTPTRTSPQSPILKESLEDLRPGNYIIRVNWAFFRVRIPEFPEETHLIADTALVQAGCPQGEGMCCWAIVEFDLKRGAATVGSLSFETSERLKRENVEIEAHEGEVQAFFEEMADSIQVSVVSCN